jgi:hypothetical protein
MIPFAPPFCCDETPPAPAALTVEFPGGASALSMGVGGNAAVRTRYNGAGDPVDYIDLLVYPNETGGIQWNPYQPINTDSFDQTANYNAAEEGWLGPGTYRIRAVARRIGSGLFDVVSNDIILTVTP